MQNVDRLWRGSWHENPRHPPGKMGTVGDGVAEAAGGDQDKVYGSVCWLSMAQHAISWLDDETNARVCGIVHTPTERHPDLLAAILISSVARHDEHSLTGLDPSDVDLVAVFDADELARRDEPGLRRDALERARGGVAR